MVKLLLFTPLENWTTTNPVRDSLITVFVTIIKKCIDIIPTLTVCIADRHNRARTVESRLSESPLHFEPFK